MNLRLVCVTMTTLALAALSSGCCCMDRYYHGDCQRPAMWGRNMGPDCASGVCASGDCDTGCDDGCASGACGAPACGTCGPHNLCHFNPLKRLWNAIHCSSGCGEFYFDEWINDPPEACDPCDNYGGFVGPRHCPPRWWLGARHHGSFRCGSNCDPSCGFETSDCGAPGCTSCGHSHSHDYAPSSMESMDMVPTPMPETIEGVPTQARRPKASPTPAMRRVSYNQPRAKTYSKSTRTTRFTPAASEEAPVGTGVRRR